MKTQQPLSCEAESLGPVPVCVVLASCPPPPCSMCRLHHSGTPSDVEGVSLTAVWYDASCQKVCHPSPETQATMTAHKNSDPDMKAALSPHPFQARDTSPPSTRSLGPCHTSRWYISLLAHVDHRICCNQVLLERRETPRIALPLAQPQ